MPLNSKGCRAKINKVFNITPTYQSVEIYTWKRNPPTTLRKYSVDFRDLAFLRNNTTKVEEGDIIYIKSFSISSEYSPAKGNRRCLNVWEWELCDKLDYSKLEDIEYKGSDYEDDES